MHLARSRICIALQLPGVVSEPKGTLQFAQIDVAAFRTSEGRVRYSNLPFGRDAAETLGTPGIAAHIARPSQPGQFRQVGIAVVFCN